MENIRKNIVIFGEIDCITSWLVRDLLEAGHEVRILVEKIDEEKCAQLSKLTEDLEGALKVIQSDSMEEDVLKDVNIVFYTKRPTIGNLKILDDSTVEEKLEEIRSMFSAINKATTVEKVVITGVLDTIFCDRIEFEERGRKPFSEENWNTKSSKNYQPYGYLTTVLEKEIWRLYEELGENKTYNIAIIIPGLMIGPAASKGMCETSSIVIRNLLSGGMAAGTPEVIDPISDVRDVAKASVLAAFNMEAKGRFLVANESASFLDLAKIVENNFPGKYKLPKKNLPKWIVSFTAPKAGLDRNYVKRNIGCDVKIDNSKSKDILGLTYRMLKDTVIDQVNQL